jgi:hypothetical protein
MNRRFALPPNRYYTSTARFAVGLSVRKILQITGLAICAVNAISVIKSADRRRFHLESS